MMTSEILNCQLGEYMMAHSDSMQRDGCFTLFGERSEVQPASDRFPQVAPDDRMVDRSPWFDSLNSAKDDHRTGMNLAMPGASELKVEINEEMILNFLRDNTPPNSEFAWDGTEITRSSQVSPRSPRPVSELWNLQSHLKMSTWVTDSILQTACFTPSSLTPPMTPTTPLYLASPNDGQLEEPRKPVPSMLDYAAKMRQKLGNSSPKVSPSPTTASLVSGLDNLRLIHASPTSEPAVCEELRKWINCDICFKSFSSKDLMLSHQSSEHQSFHQLHRCKSCPFVCKRRSAMKLHLARVHSTEMLQCPQCPEKFSLQWSLDDHMRKCHVFYMCNGCKRPIGDIGDANSFVLHNLSRKCLKCDAEFTCVWLFVQHSLQHSLSGWCPLCPAFLEDPLSLEEHVEAHAGPFKQVHSF
ncbi:zinc finger protein 827-like [Cloeon dipterum]|uniref:zinc finger protein 827-like n=1 Tax=Cloeon dipterum TaxID=197152 RepID=UPI00321FA3E5